MGTAAAGPRPSHGSRSSGQDGFPRIAARTPGRDPASVAAIRGFTRATLQRWGAARRCDDITLVVSELLANALRHAGPRPGGWPVRVGLVQPAPGSGVLCAVADPSPAVPLPPPPGHLGESGRGLRVIGELSDQWGCAAHGSSGKVVWAMFAVAGPALPQRAPGRPRPVRLAVMKDRAVLARVLRGLENL
jgi:Histidine kinase-like ATPase domain